jgi:hypothetical protein
MSTADSQTSAFKLGRKESGKVNSSTRIKKKPKELKSYHETCQKCNLKVSSRAMFCGHCGYVQIKNDLIHESSTSVYDPGDRTVRPWREKSIVAKNNWKSRMNGKIEMGNREPWRPTMRQARVNKRVVLGIPSLLKHGAIAHSAAAPELTAPQKRKQYDEERKIEVRYRGRIWRRGGEQHRRKRGFAQMPSMWTIDSPSGESCSCSFPPLLLLCSALHFSELHCSALLCTALHCFALLCLILYCL